MLPAVAPEYFGVATFENVLNKIVSLVQIYFALFLCMEMYGGYRKALLSPPLLGHEILKLVSLIPYYEIHFMPQLVCF